jgi:SET domain-containing protein
MFVAIQLECKLEADFLQDAYVMYLSSELWIDAGRYGGHARFINHSCEPNCVVERWIVGDELRLGVFAKRQILVGKELTIDYNYRYDDLIASVALHLMEEQV